MRSVIDIARYLLVLERKEVEQGTSRRLHALCFYAQGWGLALLNQPFFAEPIEGWATGPVIPALRHPIMDGLRAGGSQEDFFEDEHEVMKAVVDNYGSLPERQLLRLACAEDPWIYAFNSRGNRTIPHDHMKRYFENQVTSSFQDLFSEELPHELD